MSEINEKIEAEFCRRFSKNIEKVFDLPVASNFASPTKYTKYKFGETCDHVICVRVQMPLVDIFRVDVPLNVALIHHDDYVDQLTARVVISLCEEFVVLRRHLLSMYPSDVQLGNVESNAKVIHPAPYDFASDFYNRYLRWQIENALDRLSNTIGWPLRAEVERLDDPQSVAINVSVQYGPSIIDIYMRLHASALDLEGPSYLMRWVNDAAISFGNIVKQREAAIERERQRIRQMRKPDSP